MSEEGDLIVYVVVAVLAVIIVLFLITPHTGNIAGYSITLPGFAWVGFAAFSVLALYLFFRHRA